MHTFVSLTDDIEGLFFKVFLMILTNLGMAYQYVYLFKEFYISLYWGHIHYIDSIFIKLCHAL